MARLVRSTPRRCPSAATDRYSTPTGYTLPTTGTLTGTYQWVAAYSGDGNNETVSSTNGDEPVTVAPASPAIVTAANPTAIVGATRLQDTATLSEGYNPTGEITFTLYASDDTVVYSEQVAAAGNATVGTTTGWLPTQAGTYYWTANYSGDGNNAGIISGATDEPVTVSGSASSVSTAIADNSGGTVRDSAIVAGTPSGVMPTGTVTYSFSGHANGTRASPERPRRRVGPSPRISRPGPIR